MEPIPEKKSHEEELGGNEASQELEKETEGTQAQSNQDRYDADYLQEKEVADPSGTDTRVEQPGTDSRANTAAPSEQDLIDKEMGDTVGPELNRLSTNRLSADLDLITGRRKRESIESRLSSARNSSVLSDSDDEGDGSDVIPGHLALPVAQRPEHSRGITTASGVSVGSRRSMPPLRRKESKLAQKEAHPWQHLGITLGLPAILLFDLIIPIIIYYTWYNKHTREWKNNCREQFPNRECPLPKPEYDAHILGYAIICFGFGELWILIARVWRLVKHREECAPLLSRNRWELDATSWVYGVAMIMALIPFVVSADLEIPVLYLYSPSFIMGFLGILMVVTTFFPFKLPIGINSQPRGSPLRPFIYYAAEDFVAVDGLQDREFRVRYNERYESNKMFRQFFRNLTLWWILGVCIYIGSVSAIIFTLPFHYAFGLSFGVLFAYIACWAGVTAIWVDIEMKREHRVYEEGEVEA